MLFARRLTTSLSAKSLCSTFLSEECFSGVRMREPTHWLGSTQIFALLGLCDLSAGSFAAALNALLNRRMFLRLKSMKCAVVFVVSLAS